MTIIENFTTIRDIPYTIPLSLDEKDCCCSGKHMQLKKLFEIAGFKARYRVCSFLWSTMELPQKVLAVSHEDYSTHVFLEILIHDQWITVDATRDPALHNILSINERDGTSHTSIAVPPIKIFSPEKSLAIMAAEDDEEILRDLEKHGKFYHTFNEWLQ
jgi:hypothetical protein